MIFYRYVAETLFFIFTAMIFSGGLIVVRSHHMMNAVLGLALTLCGVAGLFFHLGSQFLALMQVLIYVGAVCIIIAFGIMVGPKQKQEETSWVSGRRNRLLAFSACGVGLVLLLATILETTWAPAPFRQGDFSVQCLGINLLYQYCLAFELVSVVLLVAIVGALIIANINEGEAGQ
ncbi:MAG: NADH-quinone oxidoreductase subunit J [Desulfuromonadales bacterium]|nr:NADH-quinone oxidoreductase subunit J [Desulfuromonadales bacterium]